MAISDGHIRGYDRSLQGLGMTIIISQLKAIVAPSGSSMAIFDDQFVIMMNLRGPSMAGGQLRVIDTPFGTKCGDL